jgi:hypothetical protein
MLPKERERERERVRVRVHVRVRVRVCGRILCNSYTNMISHTISCQKHCKRNFSSSKAEKLLLLPKIIQMSDLSVLHSSQIYSANYNNKHKYRFFKWQQIL